MQHANILGCIKPQAVLDTFADGALAHGANHSLVDLLALYQAGDCLLISPAGSRLGQGVACALDADEWRRETTTRDEAACALSKKVQALLRQASAGPSFSGRPVVMGAIPFDIRQLARLMVPKQLVIGAGPQDHDLASVSNGSLIQAVRTASIPAPAIYEAAVADALKRFQHGELEKVVLARALDVTLAAAPDHHALLQRLVQHNLQGYTYAVPLQGEAEDAHERPIEPAFFIGATPELLVRRQGRRVIVNPMAGSAARSADAQSDVFIGQQLLQSAKDRHEHAVVVDAVEQALRPLCRTLDVPARPSLATTDALWHLSTIVTGELADPVTTSLDLALALHPTPAVGGHPTPQAFAAIDQLEPFNRGLYAGFVGWCDLDGDGEWAVSLRCAELRGRKLRLFAGAGIVEGSDPAAERHEIDTKLRTMLSALGMDTPID